MNKLRELREDKNLRAFDVAVKSGVSLSLLYLIEHGYMPSEDTKRKIAVSLERSIQEIFPE